MMNFEFYNLTKEDFKLLSKLIKIGEAIERLYKKLYELEIAGLKGSAKYNKYLDHLHLSISVEDNNYNKIRNDQKLRLIDYLNNYELLTYDLSDLESVIHQDNKKNVLRRILKTLNDSVNHIEENEIILMDFESLAYIYEEIKDSSLAVVADDCEEIYYDDEKMQDLTAAFHQMSTVFQEEMLNVFLTYIDDNIKSADSKYNNELKKVKYDIAFIFKNIENSLVNNDFNVKEAILLHSKLAFDLLGFDESLYKILQNSYGYKVAIQQICEMLDNKVSKEKIELINILRQTILRAVFLIMDEEGIMGMNYVFHLYIDENKYNSNAIDSINSTFDNVEIDRNDQKILSYNK